MIGVFIKIEVIHFSKLHMNYKYTLNINASSNPNSIRPITSNFC